MIPIPDSLHDAALAYGAAGVKVFRVRRNKAPYANCARCDKDSSLYVKHRPEDCRCGVATCHGFWSATTDLDLIHRWWTEEPDANIGAPCKLNGWAVLDIDPRNGGHASLCALEERVGVLPGTVMQITGGDGLHALYQSPDFDLPKEPFAGVEFKHNNYIVLAPSVHASGGRYRWSGDGQFRRPEAAWPAALLPRKEKRERAAVAALPPGDLRHRFWRGGQHGGRGKRWTIPELVQYVMDSVEGDRQYGRNNRLYFAACRAHEQAERGLLNLVEAEVALLAAAAAVGTPDGEAQATFDSASTRPLDRRSA